MLWNLLYFNVIRSHTNQHKASTKSSNKKQSYANTQTTRHDGMLHAHLIYNFVMSATTFEQAQKGASLRTQRKEQGTTCNANAYGHFRFFFYSSPSLRCVHTHYCASIFFSIRNKCSQYERNHCVCILQCASNLFHSDNIAFLCDGWCVCASATHISILWYPDESVKAHC